MVDTRTEISGCDTIYSFSIQEEVLLDSTKRIYNSKSIKTTMETFIEATPFTDDHSFGRRRENALKELTPLLESNGIDKPLLTLIRKCADIPYCFTLQCCYGHFVHEPRKNKYTLDHISLFHEVIGSIEYRIAYLALCIENNESGRNLFRDLKSVADIDPQYVQFGSAEWFWDRCVNSYVLQVEPAKDKNRDTAWVNYEEALHIERIRNQFFDKIEKIVDAHSSISSGVG
jgi:hypothetical protein